MCRQFDTFLLIMDSADVMCRKFLVKMRVPRVLSPSLTHVFGLTLFSIEVFGLIPASREYLRHRSWREHLFLTLAAIGARAGVGTGLRVSRLIFGIAV